MKKDHRSGRYWCASLLTALGLTLVAAGPFRAGDGVAPPLRSRPKADERLLATLRSHRCEVQPVLFSPDGKLLASGSFDGVVRLWDAATGKQTAVLRCNAGQVGKLAFSPDGATLAAAADKQVTLWDVPARKKKATLRGHNSDVHGLAFSADGRSLATRAYLDARIWDPKTGKARTEPLLTSSRQPVLAFSPDGTLLATVDDRGEYSRVKLWNAATGKEIAVLENQTDEIYDLRFSDDGRHLTSASVEEITWWDVAGRKAVGTRPFGQRVFAFAFNRAGTSLAASDHSSMVCILDLQRGKKESTMEGNLAFGMPLTFSPDGGLLGWATSEHHVKLWDVKQKALRATLRGHTKMIIELAFSPDGQTLASGSWDGTVRLWEAGMGSEK